MHSLRRITSLFDKFCKHHSLRFLTSQQTAPEQNELTKDRNIVVEQNGAIRIIGINRPTKKNCLDTATVQELSDALDEFEKDENTLVGILHGRGGNFCSGFDLHEIANYDEKSNDTLPQLGALANRTELLSKPMIAALDGYVVDVGLELALMCDIRVVDTTAMLGFLNRRFGIPILNGGTVRLPALVGYSVAMDMILTGRLINADEALKYGLANRITSCGAVFGNALSYANSLLKFSQKTLLADRASAHFATFSSKQLDEALQFEKDNSSHLLFEEGIKGAKMFTEKGIGKHGKFYQLTEQDTSIRKLSDEFL